MCKYLFIFIKIYIFLLSKNDDFNKLILSKIERERERQVFYVRDRKA